MRSSLCERTVRLNLRPDGTGGALLEAVHFTAEQRDVLDVMVSLTASCVRDALCTGTLLPGVKAEPWGIGGALLEAVHLTAALC